MSQLPSTYPVLSENDAVDFGWAAQVVETDLPSGAIVLHDGTAADGLWRQPFFGASRYFEDADHAQIETPRGLAVGRSPIARNAGPVHLLILDAPCVNSVACDSPELEIGVIKGWEVADRFDRFTLYRPVAGQSGRAGAIKALKTPARAHGPGYNRVNRRAADRLR